MNARIQENELKAVRYVILFITLLLQSLIAGAQSGATNGDLVTAIQLEYTITGPQYGTAVMYETQKQWGAGVFYQVGSGLSDEIVTKDQFYGAQLQVPLVRTERISFFTALRGGLVNERFLVVVPGLETRINVGRRIGVSFGMSLRKSYPSVSSKFAFKLF